MSVDVKRMKEQARDDSIEAKMKHILADVSGIEEKMKRLAKQREFLLQRLEELKDAKLIRDTQVVRDDDKWAKENFEWSQRLRETMKTIFKLKEFRPQQLQTINCILSKKDVLMIAPTGGGKSLCYQLPGLMANGITIVVSPLISLMEDQVWSLKKYGVNAALLCSMTDKADINNILKQMIDGGDNSNMKILYVTPERMAKSKRFMNAMQKCYAGKRLHLIAVDEVHCISQYGNDFRPDYKFLGTMKTMFPDTPILGVTATATTKVILDIRNMLNLEQPIILKAEFNRPNLYYHVMEKPADKEQCVELLYELLSKRFAGQSGIIYAFSIADTEELALELKRKGVEVRPYNANLTNDRRTAIHSKWLNGEIQAVVATVAFGMGIDKPDVRFVIHHTMSKSMENYYQESGRAGRDGKRAECILLYRSSDIFRITTMVFTEHTGLRNAYQMVQFAIDGSNCRRDIISKHFSDVWNTTAKCNKMCDRCYHKDSVKPPRMNINQECLNLYKIIDHATDMDSRLTPLKLVEAWYHKGKTNCRVKEIPSPTFERFYGEQMIAFLLTKGYLKEDFHFTAFTTHSYIAKGNKLAQEGGEIFFNGARIFELPDLKEVRTKSDANPRASKKIPAASHSDSPLAKKPKKEKSRSFDGNHSDASLNSSRVNPKKESSPKKKKKIRMETECNDDSSSSEITDDCVILVEGSDVIEID